MKTFTEWLREKEQLRDFWIPTRPKKVKIDLSSKEMILPGATPLTSLFERKIELGINGRGVGR